MYPGVKRAILKVLETATSSFPKEYKMHKVAKGLAAAFIAVSMSTAQTPAMAVQAPPSQTFTETRAVSQNPAETPAFLGGELHGLTTQTLSVDEYGEVTATINNDTGEVTTTYPDGSAKTITAEESAQALRARLNEASPEQIAGLQASMEERISKEQVRPYVVGLVGAGHAASWGKVLALAAVNPAIAGLAFAGETVFWTWVSTHC
ncbi:MULTISPECIES: hypothetical protein [Corynebacterium]|uniref:hypothetical protein n=2 Tax=Corynebacteriaceae TaxID=1653 RepID=UPI0003B86286|nr:MULTISPECIES: hypothetical protein [Corynebacterium]ERS74595.1 hypothetical protein HMPREF1300_00457 [Corynebacterium sp. KPL2004]ERS42709.1 hypothetical protein HMPREF1287_02086 [Corynebacterium sp. KPL1986]ERS43515.1 hypothetical protein HMPREF1293_00462 [Corynebacterium sp. KPL1996]ERS75778.1 hypothetical protein HMPREF1295_00363 [Corynebacterium sp. KPL1998]MDK4246293.1 hypothetical protein [Corynebacterium accolens]